MFTINLNVLKNAPVDKHPWDHIVIEDYIDRDIAKKVSKKMQLEYSWKYDTHQDMKGCVQVAVNTENFEHFNSKNFWS